MAEDTKEPHGRDGRFQKGVSGNPGGRARMREDVKEMLACATPKAAQRLVEALDAQRAVVVSDGAERGSRVEFVTDHDMRTKAAEMILSRLYGKPAQAITDGDGEPFKMGLVILPARENQ